MRWVDQAVTRPHRCAVVPYIGNGSGHAFLDTGQDLDLEHVYISDAGCDLIAEARGWVHPQRFEQELEANRNLQARVEQLEEEIRAADEFQSNIDGLTRQGMVVRKQPGRKPKKEEVA